MTKKEFWKKWMAGNDGPPIWRDTRLQRSFMRDLDKVVKTYSNHLHAGITNAIFELEQAYKKGAKQ